MKYPCEDAGLGHGYKTRSVFDRYNIVGDTDFESAALKRETPLQTQRGTILGIIHHLKEKKESPRNG